MASKKSSKKPVKTYKTLKAFYAAGLTKVEVDDFDDTLSFFVKSGATRKEINDGADANVCVLEVDKGTFIRDALKRHGMKATYI